MYLPVVVLDNPALALFVDMPRTASFERTGQIVDSIWGHIMATLVAPSFNPVHALGFLVALGSAFPCLFYFHHFLAFSNVMIVCFPRSRLRSKNAHGEIRTSIVQP